MTIDIDHCCYYCWSVDLVIMIRHYDDIIGIIVIICWYCCWWWLAMYWYIDDIILTLLIPVLLLMTIDDCLFRWNWCSYHMLMLTVLLTDGNIIVLLMVIVETMMIIDAYDVVLCCLLTRWWSIVDTIVDIVLLLMVMPFLLVILFIRAHWCEYCWVLPWYDGIVVIMILYTLMPDDAGDTITKVLLLLCWWNDAVLTMTCCWCDDVAWFWCRLVDGDPVIVIGNWLMNDCWYIGDCYSIVIVMVIWYCSDMLTQYWCDTLPTTMILMPILMIVDIDDQTMLVLLFCDDDDDWWLPLLPLVLVVNCWLYWCDVTVGIVDVKYCTMMIPDTSLWCGSIVGDYIVMRWWLLVDDTEALLLFDGVVMLLSMMVIAWLWYCADIFRWWYSVWYDWWPLIIDNLIVIPLFWWYCYCCYDDGSVLTLLNVMLMWYRPWWCVVFVVRYDCDIGIIYSLFILMMMMMMVFDALVEVYGSAICWYDCGMPLWLMLLEVLLFNDIGIDWWVIWILLCDLDTFHCYGITGIVGGYWWWLGVVLVMIYYCWMIRLCVDTIIVLLIPVRNWYS